MSENLDRLRELSVQLEGQERLLEAIFECSLDAIIVMDDKGLIVKWNSKAEAMFGYPSEEAVGQPLGDLIIPEYLREIHARGLALYLETGEGPILNRRVALEALRRDGSLFPVELTVVPVKEAPLFVGFIRDLSQ